jgi:hypothetical protein
MRKVYAPGLFMLRKKGCLPLFAEGPGLKPFLYRLIFVGLKPHAPSKEARTPPIATNAMNGALGSIPHPAAR